MLMLLPHKKKKKLQSTHEVQARRLCVGDVIVSSRGTHLRVQELAPGDPAVLVLLEGYGPVTYRPHQGVRIVGKAPDAEVIVASAAAALAELRAAYDPGGAKALDFDEEGAEPVLAEA